MASGGGNEKKGGFGRSFGNLGGGLGGGFAKLGESIRQQADGIGMKVGAGANTDGEATLASETAATVESTNSSAPAKSPDAVSKEELLEILQKMNKKVKALSSLRVQLTERVKKTEAEKKQLISFVKDEILDQQHDIHEEDGKGSDQVLAQLRAAWHATSERNQMVVQELQKEFKNVTLTCREEVEKVRETVQCEADAKIETIRAEAMNANTKDEWERSKQKLIQQHQEEVAGLREQFRETQEKMMEFKEAAESNGIVAVGEDEKASSSETALSMTDEQVSTKIAEMEKRHAAEMKKVKMVATTQLQKLKEKMLLYKEAAELATEGASATDEGSERAMTIGQGTDVAEIEKRHAEELKKVKMAASAQLQNFKKKVAAARAAELEKLKSEMAQNNNFTPAPPAVDNVEHAKQLQELRDTQQKELEAIRTNLASETKLMLEKEKEQWQSQQNDLLCRIKDETEKSRQVEFEKIRSQIKNMSPENKDDDNSPLQQINDLKNSLKEAIEQSKKEGFDYLASQTEKAREDMMKMAKNAREPIEGPREGGDDGLRDIDKKVAEVRKELTIAAEKVSDTEKKMESAQAAMVTNEAENRNLMERVTEELIAQRAEQEKVIQTIGKVPTKELEAITAYRDAVNERLEEKIISLKASKDQDLAAFCEKIKQSDSKVEWNEDNSAVMSRRQELSDQIQKIREDIENAVANCEPRLQVTEEVCSKTETASQTLANVTENAKGVLTTVASATEDSNNEVGASLEDQILMNQVSLAKKRADLAKRYNQSCIQNQQTQKELSSVKSRLADLQDALEVSKERARSTAEGVEKELREELKSKDDLLVQEQGQRTSLETQITTLQEQLETALSKAKEFEELQVQCDHLKESLSSKEGILSNEQNERASLETQIMELTEKLEAAAGKMDDYEQLQTQCEELREEVKSKNDALAAEKDERTSLESQMDTLQQNLDAASATSEEYKELQDQYKQLGEELQAKTESLTHGENERASLEAQTNSLNEQLSEATSKVDEYGEIQAKYEQLLDQLKSNDDVISQGKEERATLENKLTALQEELQTASSKLEEYGQMQTKCDQLQEELKSRDEVIEQENDQRSSLVAQITVLSEAAASKAKEHEELHAQCAQLQAELISKEDILSQEQNERASSETEISTLQEKLQAASSKLEEYGELQAQCDELQEELKSKDESLTQEQNQRSTLEAQITVLSEAAASKAKEHEELHAQCAQLQGELKSKEDILSEEQNERASSETEISTLQEKLQAASSKLEEYGELQAQCDELHEELKSKDESLTQEQNQRSTLEAQITVLSEAAASKAKEHEELHAQCAQLQGELKSKEDILSEEQNERASSETEISTLQEKLQAASSKLEEYGELQAQCDELQEELKSKDESLTQEQNQRSTLEAQITVLSEAAASKAKEHEELHAQCAQLQGELKSKEDILSEEQNERASSETEISALQEKLQAASSKLEEYGELQAQCDELQEELKSKDESLTQEQNQRSTLEAQITVLSEAAASKAKEHEELHAQCAQLEAELKSKEGVLSQEQNERASSDTQIAAMQEKLQAAANKLKKYGQVQKLCEQLRDKLKSKDESLAQEQKQRSALEARIASLSETAACKVKEYEEIQAQYAQLQAELKSKEDILSEEQNERASTDTQMSALHQKLEAASKKLEDYQQVQTKCDQLREELKSKDEVLVQEQDQRSVLEAQIIAKEEEHSRNLRDAEQKYQDLENRQLEVRKESAEAASLKDNLLPELNRTQHSVNGTKLQHENLKRDQVEIQSHLRDVQNQIDASLSQSVNLLNEMKMKMLKAQNDIAASKDVITNSAVTTSSSLAELKNTFSSEIHSKLQERESHARRMITSLVDANKLQASAFAVDLNDARIKCMASETNAASTREECAAQLKNARHTLKTISSLNSNQKEQSQKDEIVKMKQDYESQLQASEKKRKNAVELMNKLKQATATKIKSIEEKHKTSLDKALREGESKANDLRSKFEFELASMERAKHSSLQVLLSSSDAKLKTMQMNQASTANDLNKQVGHLKSELLAEFESRISEARNQKQEALDSLEKTRKSTSIVLKEELNEKLKDLETKYSTAMKEADGRRVATLESAGSRFAITLQNVRKQHAQTASALGTNTEEYISKIEAEVEKRFESVLAAREKESDNIVQKGENLCGELKKMFDEKVQGVEEKHSVAVERLQSEMSGKDETFNKLVKQLKAAIIASSSLTEENASLQSTLDSEMKSQEELKTRLDSLTKELQNTVSNSSDTAASLLQQQEQLEQEKTKFQKKIEELTVERDAGIEKSNKLRTKLSDVSTKLESTINERNQLDERLQEAAKKGVKLVESENEVAVLRDQVNKLTLEQTKSSSLLSRLQAEKDASERKHGQRTALVGMLEEQLSELNEAKTDTTAKLEAALYEIKQKNEAIESTAEKLKKAEASVKEAQDARKAASESLTMAAKGTETKKNKMVESLQREIQSLQQQIARKSAAAQRMLKERENECASLRKSNKELQHELDKGSLSDRRIFELAAKQSNRDSVASSEIEIRDKVVERLTEKLLSRDGELATAEHTVHEVEGQVEDLCRVRRREDVNLDYLKSIVVQYLSKPPGSSERAALLPVLATLLQFDGNDYKAIEEGKQKLSWWGSVAPVLIGPAEEEVPPPPPAMEPAAAQQVAPLLGSTTDRKTSHSSGTPKAHSKGTSLQF